MAQAGGQNGVTLTRREVLKRGGYLAGAAGLSTMWVGCSSGAVSDDRPHILLITMDTTRADHLGCYGYDVNTSEHVDRFAAGATVYERCISPSTWTLPSHASLFTGKFPSAHGARKDPEGVLAFSEADIEQEQASADRVRTISVDQSTMAEMLNEAGYMTMGLVSGPWLKPVFGLHKGFEHYDDRNITEMNGRLAEDVTDSALGVLDVVRDGPWFMFLNYFDPHPPFVAPPKYQYRYFPDGQARPKHGERLSDDHRCWLYDAEVYYMDVQIGRLLDGMKARGMLDRTWVILTADHGHMIGEHGEYGHADVPYQEVTRVPMMIREPGRAKAGSRTDQWIQLVDVLPMVAARVGLELPLDIQGQLPGSRTRPIITQSRTLPSLKARGSWLALHDGDMKYIANTRGNHKLFNLADDPGEDRNLLAEDPDAGSAYASRLFDYVASLPKPGPSWHGGEVDQETINTLRGTGYLK